MITHHVGLVSETKANKVAIGELMKVAAALQKQVTKDLRPVWEVEATVDAFERLEDIPVGYWPLMIVDDVPDAAGIHLDKNGQPYALAEFGKDWSLTASHECLEMLVDPTGNKVNPGISPDPGRPGTVEFLVEVADPSEDAAFAYKINGILVSDFYTPAYFDDVVKAGTRYSVTGAITAPRQVLKGGYLSWHDVNDDHWRQERWFGASSTIEDLGKFEASDRIRSVRSWIYSRTTDRLKQAVTAGDQAVPLAALQARHADNSADARASRLRLQIDAWRKKK